MKCGIMGREYSQNILYFGGFDEKNSVFLRNACFWPFSLVDFPYYWLDYSIV